ncbi:lysosome-associated membrane glycoprotein 5-like [Macrosteles quadrilineatus]|uniref:lysosome-associated membrane glycoprotein 5-like n=1 Tax=Macrosteles quadrilineatus TaxID=74068 RepID=UPI0023E2DD1D|nr:lysosome-associated membrane glycoprotein 5-like [Macrosteles quadrilineatus]
MNLKLNTIFHFLVFLSSLLATSWSAATESIRAVDSKPSATEATVVTVPPPSKSAKVTLEAGELTEVSTKKPLEKKEAISKTTTTRAPEVTTKTLYRLNAEGGTACILLRTDALIEFTYTTRLKEEIVKDIYVPETAETDGTCLEDEARLELKWPDFNLKWYFEKTPGGERWFVDKIELWFDAGSSRLEHIKNPDQKLTLSTPKSHSALLYVTPVGQAYTCLRELEVKLTNPRSDIKATVLLRELEVQPFIFKNSNFGPEYHCPAPGQSTYRSETAPLIVGSILAAACLATITGYSVFRYFKIKKVQYDTME